MGNLCTAGEDDQKLALTAAQPGDAGENGQPDPNLPKQPRWWSGPPLLMSAQRGECGVLNALLKAYSEVDAKNSDGVTALFAAAEQGQLAAVKVLLAASADVNLGRNNGATPLYIAVEKAENETIEALLAGRANVDQSREDGTTPLINASQIGDVSVVQLLLQGRAKVDHRKNDGATPLFVSSQKGRLDVVKALLAAGADKAVSVTASNDKEYTALQAAELFEHADVVELLQDEPIEADANVLPNLPPLPEAHKIEPH